MGKRLEQQPMYPQYTYYYPHYLQTKVCRTYALPNVLPPSLLAGPPPLPSSLPILTPTPPLALPHLLSSVSGDGI